MGGGFIWHDRQLLDDLSDHYPALSIIALQKFRKSTANIQESQPAFRAGGTWSSGNQKIEVVVEIVTENLGLDYRKRGFPTYTYDPATTPIPKYFFLGSRRHQPLERGPRIFRLRDRPPAKSAR